ncbi:aminotransferase class III-fold pyridoxal phosphate-dependent enzyme [Halobacteriovorax sp. HLS]|uniref:aminotransferase class III-fold pyridoxal phosphate-dependent enzyme n=1 Tax=Halobacteriovorax sp. HLS TaxID=2234000 RepID=UPI000FDA4138|nr:aminotransferase class III-fold pyridoxal phosphate-dependent enzyme [Halobacteriovorax sp. HLS]
MKLELINKSSETHSKEILQSYYKNNLIPPEKKNYLTNLESSTGPFLAIEGSNGTTQYMMDAASQIATLGLGFSPSVFFGTAHYLETWLNNKDGKEFKSIRAAFESFLKRKSGFKNLDLTICNSGAEANEIALGYCYRSRHNLGANKVLAFEGSFHGRMMVTLSSTWNKTKRIPFEWPEHETIYCPFPGLDTDEILVPSPDGWQEFWENSSSNELEVPVHWLQDPQVAKEVASLLSVKEQLRTNKIFAIIVEPMQCEGGDCYASGRFNEALISLAHSYHVKVVHDEVQTGFHLGKEFFWHRELNMKNSKSELLSPDYVVCAKKAQVGLVLSHENIWGRNKYEEFQVASVVRGYLHAIALDQSQDKIVELENTARTELEKLVKKFPEKITRPRANGMAFAFEVPSAQDSLEFISKRFDHGLLYYPAGEKTLRFRLNTSFTKEDIKFLFERIEVMAKSIFNNEQETFVTHIETKSRDSEIIYEWQKLLTKLKLNALKKSDLKSSENLDSILKLFSKSCDKELFIIDSSNFEDWRTQIEQIQKDIYEPTRQTDIGVFEKSAQHKNSVAIGVKEDDKLLAIAFSSPLAINPLERGVRKDPYIDNDNVLYMIDSTVTEALQGRGLGRVLKYALTAIAMTKETQRIHGRNRDRMAASMLNINLSLGAYELMYMKEDYPDFEEYRDVFYYTSTTKWKELPLNLSNAIQSPLCSSDLTDSYIEEQLSFLVNKVCLSNFVSQRFLDQLRSLTSLLPKTMQHAYTTSGQSECVDKVAKTIWYCAENKDNHMITFADHFFGNGSFLARSLSYQKDKFFNVSHLANPTEDTIQDVLDEVEEKLKQGAKGGVWIEPIQQKTMKRTPREFLKKLKVLCEKYKTKLIYNETASACYRYDNSNFFTSNIEELAPNAAICFLGGQAGLCFTNKDIFIDKPLMLISTWDGDEFSLSNFNYATGLINSDLENFTQVKIDFTNKLTEILSSYDIEEMELENGVGYFIGNISKSLQKFFKKSKERYIVCPSYGQMKKFLTETVS